MPCVFRALSGPYRGKVFPLDTRRPLVVGNALEADFTIPDRDLAAFHCEVEFDSGRDGRMALLRARTEDTPLYVDGVPMDEVLLQSGERVRLGNTTLEFLEGGKRSDPTGGRPARPGSRCAACRRPVPNLGGGRQLLNRSFCWRCIDLRLIVRRELGRYRILRKIDRNVCEITYAAEDLRADQPERVALHVLKAERQGDPRVLRRFLTKAMFAYALDHPVFARTRDLVHRPEVASYVTDLTEWPTLQDRLLVGETFELGAALRMATELAEGLRFARSKGMIVGRIRPARLIVSDDGQVQLRDYWLSLDLEAAVAEGIGAPEAPPLPPEPPKGTDDEPVSDEEMSSDLRRYLAPPAEDLEHYHSEARDVRPIGILLVQLITGTHPGEAAPHEVFERVKRVFARARTTTSAPSPPAVLAKILARSLSTNPANRYRRIEDLIRDLRSAYLAL